MYTSRILRFLSASRSNRFLLLSSIVTCASVLQVSTVAAQWQTLANFGKAVHSIYFMQGDCSARVGFVGTEGWTIQKTTDGGQSWSQVMSNPIGDNYVSTFTFKDSLTGWCTICQLNAIPTSDAIWKTTDGGNTWFSLRVQGVFASVYYQQYSQRLFASTWDGKNGKDLVSTDGGQNWLQFIAQNAVTAPSGTNPRHNGFAFSDAKNGVLSALPGSGYYRTSEGGVTWTQISPSYNVTDDEEGYQPFVLPCTSSYVLMEEGPMKFVRSDDGGLTWKTLSVLPSNPYFTGDVEGDATHLFIQNTQSVLQSVDGGVTWASINGPGGDYDYRMATRGGFLFAGSISGEVARYQYGTSGKQVAQLSVSPDTVFFPSSVCTELKLPIHVSAVTTCSDCPDSMLLSSLQSSGSTYFTIVSAPDSNSAVTANDSVVIDHRPAATAFDTATLTLNFIQYGEPTVRKVVLIGQSIPRTNEHVGLVTNSGGTQLQVRAGDTVHAIVLLRDAVKSSVGLTTVSFTLPFDSRMLSKLNIQGLSGWVKSVETDLPNSIQVVMSSTAHDISADEQIADVTFIAEIGLVTNSSVTMSDVQLNAGDPNFENCTLTHVAELDTIAVAMVNSCGDSTLRAFISGKPLVQILDVRPDPVSNGPGSELMLDLQVSLAETVKISMFDLTGRTVIPPIPQELPVGEVHTLLNTSSLAEGVYVLTIEGAGVKTSRKIVVQSR